MIVDNRVIPYEDDHDHSLPGISVESTDKSKVTDLKESKERCANTESREGFVSSSPCSPKSFPKDVKQASVKEVSKKRSLKSKKKKKDKSKECKLNELKEESDLNKEDPDTLLLCKNTDGSTIRDLKQSNNGFENNECREDFVNSSPCSAKSFPEDVKQVSVKDVSKRKSLKSKKNKKHKSKECKLNELIEEPDLNYEDPDTLLLCKNTDVEKVTKIRRVNESRSSENVKGSKKDKSVNAKRKSSFHSKELESSLMSEKSNAIKAPGVKGNKDFNCLKTFLEDLNIQSTKNQVGRDSMNTVSSDNEKAADLEEEFMLIAQKWMSSSLSKNVEKNVKTGVSDGTRCSKIVKEKTKKENRVAKNECLTKIFEESVTSRNFDKREREKINDASMEKEHRVSQNDEKEVYIHRIEEVSLNFSILF